MIGIVDYNAGNIRSVEHALEFLGAEFRLSKDPLELKDADKIIFPGVGDAAYAMEQLRATGFDSFLKEFASGGRPLMGICLGSQIVFDYSEEGGTECLGLLRGKIVRMEGLVGGSVKIPHMGWNNVEAANGGSRLMEDIPAGSDFYFVHSYVIQPDDASVIKGVSDYGARIPAVIEKDNISVFQFHPEKSGAAGLQILRNFVEM